MLKLSMVIQLTITAATGESFHYHVISCQLDAYSGEIPHISAGFPHELSSYKCFCCRERGTWCADLPQASTFVAPLSDSKNGFVYRWTILEQDPIFAITQRCTRCV